MNRYILSPEFHRHLWLRFSWLRALFVPVALLCVIYSHYMIYDERWAEIASGRLFWAYVLIVGLWGNHEAANALRDEVRANTWDMQRMTPCGPAPWIFGKVLGVTCFVWYVALLVLAAAFALYFIGGAPNISRCAPRGPARRTPAPARDPPAAPPARAARPPRPRSAARRYPPRP